MFISSKLYNIKVNNQLKTMVKSSNYFILDKLCFALKYGALGPEKELYQGRLLSYLKGGDERVRLFVGYKLYDVEHINYNILKILIKNNKLKKLIYEFSPSLTDEELIKEIDTYKGREYIIYIAKRKALSKKIVKRLLKEKHPEIVVELLKRDIVFDESSLREISQIINKDSKKREFFENYLSKHNYSICLGEKSSINKQKYLLDKKKIENYFINNQLNIKRLYILINFDVYSYLYAISLLSSNFIFIYDRSCDLP